MEPRSGVLAVGLFVPEPSDELIRVDGRDAVAREDRRREIAQVVGHDHFRLAVDRRRQDMPVVGIGKRQGRYQGLLTLPTAKARGFSVHRSLP